MHCINHGERLPIVLVLVPEWTVLWERLIHEARELLIRKFIKEVANTFICIFGRLLFGQIMQLILRFFVSLIVLLAWRASVVNWICHATVCLVRCITVTAVTVYHFSIIGMISLSLALTWGLRERQRIILTMIILAAFQRVNLANRAFLISSSASSDSLRILLNLFFCAL